MKKVMFISSMGGHLSELMHLKDLFKNYNYMLVTEKHKSTLKLKEEHGSKVEYLSTGNKDNMLKYIFVIPYNVIKSLMIFLKFKPDVIVTTGSHTCVAMCYIAKIFRKKVVYIETFANVKTKTLTGKLVYPVADKFIVQWEPMLKLYPKAVCWGWIF